MSSGRSPESGSSRSEGCDGCSLGSPSRCLSPCSHSSGSSSRRAWRLAVSDSSPAGDFHDAGRRRTQEPETGSSSVREEGTNLGLAHVIDPREAYAFELHHVVDFQGGDQGLPEASGFGSVRQDQVHVDAVRDPLNLRNVLVLHRDEAGAMIQDDITEVLETYLLAAALLKVVLCDVDLRSNWNLANPSTGEVRMERRLHVFDRREARDLHRDRVGHEEVAVRVPVDQLPVLGVQRLRGYLDVVQAEAEGKHEIPQRGWADSPATEGL